MDKLNFQALGERLKIGGERLKAGGAEMSRKVSLKMKEMLQGQSQEAKMVDEATSENLTEPNWGLNLRICGLLNAEELNGSEVMRAIKKKIACKSTISQKLSLDLLDACAMNCDKTFSVVASEKVLDEMIRMIDNPQTHQSNRLVAFQMIKAWGESEDLLYLPVFQQIYMNLKSRDVPFNTGDGGNLSTEFTSAESGFGEPLFSLPGLHPNLDLGHHQNVDVDLDDITYLGSGLSTEEKNEVLVVTRNSLEILSSLLNSEKPNEAIKDDLTLGMLERCRDAQPVIQRIMETVGDDEDMLFCALNLHEELLLVLSKYAEMEALLPPPHHPGTNPPAEPSIPSAGGANEAASPGKPGEEAEQALSADKDK
ncbi:unnamed protein product [Spirodela intermedia]|uniref:Uncharacterized protein n=1 Tax=Spirodela intermedia TaxID=51605 RepID=A0A7I8KZK8_SPIIN|nr:unnamed protein product [Spirodela intermedia]